MVVVAVVVRAEGLVAVAIQSPLWDPLGGVLRMRSQYNAHLSVLSLWYMKNSRILLAGTVLPTLHS